MTTQSRSRCLCFTARTMCNRRTGWKGDCAPALSCWPLRKSTRRKRHVCAWGASKSPVRSTDRHTRTEYYRRDAGGLHLKANSFLRPRSTLENTRHNWSPSRTTALGPGSGNSLTETGPPGPMGASASESAWTRANMMSHHTTTTGEAVVPRQEWHVTPLE